MRTVVLLVIMLLSAEVFPQSIKVRSVKNVTPGTGGSYLLAGVVPGSGHLLLAGEGYNGLSLLDPFSDNRKYSSVWCYDIPTGDREILIEKGRDVNPPAVAGNSVLLVSASEARIEQKGIVLKSGNDRSFVVIEEMMPVLYRGGERKSLMPNGEGFYIWASLSPDGTKILYNYQGRGSFICDTEGNILHDLGRINAPKWFNDRLVIGMDDKDDGHRITSSELVAYSLGDKTKRTITATPERSEMFPFASGNRKIAFCTDNGEIYIMKVRVR
jgi:hypothetical protein